MRQSVSVVICFVGFTAISWSRKRQGFIEMYSYSEEFCIGQVSTEEAISVQYMLRYLGVPMKGPTAIFGTT